MNSILHLFHASKRFSAGFYFYQRRFRVKQKWASNKKTKLPRELALDHFDLYYKPVFHQLWPSIRVALLSRQKYCAVINNFVSDQQKIILELAELGASDLINLARNTVATESYSLLKKGSRSVGSRASGNSQLGSICDGAGLKITDSAGWNSEFGQINLSPKTNIYDFMPVKKILSEREQMKQEEVDQNFHRPSLIPVEVIPSRPIRFPRALQPFTVARGDVSSFSPAARDENGKLTYYLMDAGSILPVIALDLEPGCEVLDLCAAPGGKSYLMLQTLLPEKLTCIDNSYSRIVRLREVMKLFFPRSYTEEKKVDVLKANGVAFCEGALEQFDRVLVDVPCFSDRHVLNEDENNIFRPSCINERLEMQNLQRELLFAGIKACKPGGIIVYSTCTLSLPQNDGAVQAALEKICQETNIEVAIEDTGMIADHFRQTFNFYGKCRYGQLVVPNLTANFGPTYFCKLHRIK